MKGFLGKSRELLDLMYLKGRGFDIALREPRIGMEVWRLGVNCQRVSGFINFRARVPRLLYERQKNSLRLRRLIK